MLPFVCLPALYIFNTIWILTTTRLSLEWECSISKKGGRIKSLIALPEWMPLLRVPMLSYFGHIVRRDEDCLSGGSYHARASWREQKAWKTQNQMDWIKSLAGSSSLQNLYSLAKDRQWWRAIVDVRAVSHDGIKPTNSRASRLMAIVRRLVVWWRSSLGAIKCFI